MKAVVAILVIATVLAGCSGSTSNQEVAAKQAAEASMASVADKFDYLLFLGITGTEGPLNWTLYESALRSASDPGASIADGFDQDTFNGVAGDGRLGSWLTTHFVFDEDRQLLGGLYTQYAGDNVRSIYAPFRGPYAGTPGLPGLQSGQADRLLAARMADEEGSTLCGLQSSTESWQIDSVAAAEAATARPLMKAHIEAYPEGEFTYYYFPKLGVDASCQAELTTPSNYWVISHVDLDDYLIGGVPTVAEVRVDASTGQVLAESVRPLYYRAPIVVDLVIADTDPAVPRTAPFARNASFVVDGLVQTLDITLNRSEAPSVERSASTRLIDPSGRIWDRHVFDDAQHGYRVTLPLPGRWTIQYDHHAVQPNGVHRIEVHAISTYT